MNERMNEWMSEWMNEWMNEWINEWMNWLLKITNHNDKPSFHDSVFFLHYLYSDSVTSPQLGLQWYVFFLEKDVSLGLFCKQIVVLPKTFALRSAIWADDVAWRKNFFMFSNRVILDFLIAYKTFKKPKVIKMNKRTLKWSENLKVTACQNVVTSNLRTPVCYQINFRKSHQV